MEVDSYPWLRSYVLVSCVPGNLDSLGSITYGLYIHNTDPLSEGSKKVCCVSNLTILVSCPFAILEDMNACLQVVFLTLD